MSPMRSRHLQLYNYGVQKQMQRKADPYSDTEENTAPAAVFDESVPIALNGPERIFIKDKYSELVAKKKRTNERLEQMRKAKLDKLEQEAMSHKNSKLYKRADPSKER